MRFELDSNFINPYPNSCNMIVQLCYRDPDNGFSTHGITVDGNTIPSGGAIDISRPVDVNNGQPSEKTEILVSWPTNFNIAAMTHDQYYMGVEARLDGGESKFVYFDWYIYPDCSNRDKTNLENMFVQPIMVQAAVDQGSEDIQIPHEYDGASNWNQFEIP